MADSVWWCLLPDDSQCLVEMPATGPWCAPVTAVWCQCPGPKYLEILLPQGLSILLLDNIFLI